MSESPREQIAFLARRLAKDAGPGIRLVEEDGQSVWIAKYEDIFLLAVARDDVKAIERVQIPGELFSAGGLRAIVEPIIAAITKLRALPPEMT